MARPELTRDVSDRYIRIATFDVDKFVNMPALLKHYTAFIEAVQKANGKVDSTYSSNVEISVLRNRKQLEDQLRSDQYTWDDHQKSYKKMIAGEEVAEWRKDSIRKWAKENGFPSPDVSDDEDADEDADADVS